MMRIILSELNKTVEEIIAKLLLIINATKTENRPRQCRNMDHREL